MKNLEKDVINELKNYLIEIKNMIDTLNNDMRCDDEEKRKMAISIANELINSIDSAFSEEKMAGVIKQFQPIH